MTEAELREKIAEELYMSWNRSDDVDWVDLSKGRKDVYRAWVSREIIALVKENYVRLADDQSLPKGLTARLNLQN